MPENTLTGKPIGTILFKEFKFDDEQVAFDLFVMTYKGWVCIDQHGYQPNDRPSDDLSEYVEFTVPELLAGLDLFAAKLDELLVKSMLNALIGQ